MSDRSPSTAAAPSPSTAAAGLLAPAPVANPVVEAEPFVPRCKIDVKASRQKGRTGCGHNGMELHGCNNPACTTFMHQNCSTLLLNTANVDAAERPTDPTVVFCTKTCYKRWNDMRKTKQKKLEKEQAKAAAAAAAGEGKATKTTWADNGSLRIPLDWMTTEPNYAHCCGGEGNNGKLKAQCHEELALMPSEKLPGIDRTDKEVKNKIEKLVSQFNAASDWMANTGAGLKEEGRHDSMEQCMKKICPHHYELEEAMKDRPSARMLINSDDMDEEPFTLDEGHSEEEEEEEDQAPSRTVEDVGMPRLPPMALDTVVAASPVAASSDAVPATPAANTTPTAVAVTANTTATTTPASSVTNSTASTAKKTKKPRLTGKGKGKGKTAGSTTDDLASEILGGEGVASLNDRAVIAKETEAAARMKEACALEGKLKAETEILNDDVIFSRLQKRKKAVDEGLCSEEDPDAHWPLKKVDSSSGK